MELVISIIAVVVSAMTFLFSALVTFRGEKRQKRQATLDALNVLQEQVFDNINKYTFSEIKNIAEKWLESIDVKNKYMEDKHKTADEFWSSNHDFDNEIGKYKELSAYLARIEHFSLGVNIGIYDMKVTERAATAYFVMLYKKLLPIISVKNCGTAKNKDPRNSYHTEFCNLVRKIQKLEGKNRC